MIVRGYKADIQPLVHELGGGFVAFAPALVGCVAEGRTQPDAVQNLDDAIDCWLQIAALQKRRIPAPVG